ncbi:RluA family pseudouridine synthase [Xylocopilactobacillus apicola]|uniref:Pseudouridine synthase n=1 Tax=Xylocopilactobacillus apicola TaxID=2932184 RepID=A0AAU9DSI8_9LACO|nr:RluA family pseudouridine synthase [Xylocopilactobacillus apicola]BDR59014.1 pseudouridine synthase [Xylocopilactobacillus apicola]
MKLNYLIEEKSQGEKISKYLRSQGISRRILKRIKYQGGEIVVNGLSQRSDYRLQINDQLTITIPDLASSSNIVRIAKPIEVIYEDNYFLAVNKPPFLPSIPKRGDDLDNVASRVKNYLYETTGEDFPIHLITRLDSDTSGVILFAKNSLSHSLFFKDKSGHGVDKEYFAVVKGQIEQDLLLMLPLGRSPEFFLRRVISDQGKSSITLVKVAQNYQEATALNVRLFTGRTHQIRAHLSAIEHPIYGDELYGGDRLLIDRQALHCQRLEFTHPFTQKKITISAPLPRDLNDLLDNFCPM